MQTQRHMQRQRLQTHANGPSVPPPLRANTQPPLSGPGMLVEAWLLMLSQTLEVYSERCIVIWSTTRQARCTVIWSITRQPASRYAPLNPTRPATAPHKFETKCLKTRTQRETQEETGSSKCSVTVHQQDISYWIWQKGLRHLQKDPHSREPKTKKPNIHLNETHS